MRRVRSAARAVEKGRCDLRRLREIHRLAREPGPGGVRRPAVQTGPPPHRLERVLRESYAKARLTDDETAAITWLAAQPDGPAKILVLSEDWSSDCRRDVPYLARLAEAGGLELRIFTRDGDTMLRKGLPDPAAGGNADLVMDYANEKNGQRWASIPVAVFFTREFVELYRYVEYPAIYHKDHLFGHVRSPRSSARFTNGW